MKFKVTFKDPDALYDAIEEAYKGKTISEINLSDEEYELVSEKRKEKTRELCSRWFEYDEYLTVEIDTEAKTCVVISVEDQPDTN